MPPVTTRPVAPEVIGRVAADVRGRHRAHIRTLHIEITADGLRLRGSARSFYGKQIAFHEVSRRCGPVLANEIEVQPAEENG